MHIAHDRENDTAYASLVAHVADGAAVRRIPVEAVGRTPRCSSTWTPRGRLLGIEVIGAVGAPPAELLEQSSPA
ncbi:DUF2283 domain-containing protein [Streptomyces sp. NPDC094143]|uniref:DUF2283 domain-containing protein n=1 Tax=Streptomyces sp. NPDC094143 TaxID=3155310 RepID=UPI0033224AE0